RRVLFRSKMNKKIAAYDKEKNNEVRRKLRSLMDLQCKSIDIGKQRRKHFREYDRYINIVHNGAHIQRNAAHRDRELLDARHMSRKGDVTDTKHKTNS